MWWNNFTFVPLLLLFRSTRCHGIHGFGFQYEGSIIRVGSPVCKSTNLLSSRVYSMLTATDNGWSRGRPPSPIGRWMGTACFWTNGNECRYTDELNITGLKRSICIFSFRAIRGSDNNDLAKTLFTLLYAGLHQPFLTSAFIFVSFVIFVKNTQHF